MADALGKLKTSTGPWMAAAVLLVAGFMYWLYAQSSSIQTGAAAGDTIGAEVPLVADTAFLQDPVQYSRERILLRPVTVEERLGRAALLLQIADSSGYPAILDRTILEQDITIVGGDNLAVAGWVFALNDSILDVWGQRNIYDSGNRERLQGKTTFFLVDSLDFVFPGEDQGAGAGPGS